MSASRVARTVAIVSLAGEPPARPPENGGFEAVLALGLTGHSADSLAARLNAAKLAGEAGAQWMVALAPGEALAHDAFELASPALGLYEAIFGSAHLRGGSEAVAKLSRLAFDTADRLPHALLHWWMPQAHLVRTELALHTLERVAAKGGRNWRNCARW